MLVSIIIPCFNNENYIEAAINSALCQTYEFCEVIVVDDGSTDSSGKIIKRFAEEVIVLRQKNSGACAARNFGLSKASGELIKFLDGDDTLEPDCVLNQVAFMANRNVVIFGDYCFLNEDGLISPSNSHKDLSGLQKGDCASLSTFLESAVLISTTLYSRSALRQINGFDISIERFQEIDLHLRLYFSGIRFEYHPGLCFSYRVHNSPSRISVARKKDAFYWHFHRFEQLVNDVQAGKQLETWSESRLVLGRLAWRIGRKKARMGAPYDAKRFFNLAIKTGGSKILQGRPIYKSLVRLFGPIWAERISMFRSHFQNILSNINGNS